MRARVRISRLWMALGAALTSIGLAAAAGLHLSLPGIVLILGVGALSGGLVLLISAGRRASAGHACAGTTALLLGGVLVGAGLGLGELIVLFTAACAMMLVGLAMLVPEKKRSAAISEGPKMVRKSD